MNCRHGFVVRDILGVNRFLCRECDERFRSYPRRAIRRIVPSEECEIRIENTLRDEYVYAEGMPVQQPLTYTLPLTDKVTFSYQLLEDDK